MVNNQFEKAILYQPWGGLGDNLQFSTLPRRFAEDNTKTFISRKNVYRNDEIKKIVWDPNPFITNSESNEAPNCGSSTTATPSRALTSARNIVEWQEIRHGLEPKSLLPEIHYTPSRISDLSDTMVVDLGAHSAFLHNKYNLIMLVENINSILKENENYRTILVNSKYNKGPRKSLQGRRWRGPLDGLYSHLEGLEIADIFHYADVVNSCKKFVCLYSGSTVLASCLRKKETLCIAPHGPEKIFGPTTWIFPTVQYMTPSGIILNDSPEWKKNFSNDSDSQ
jgi:hypothetical protein